MTKTKKGFTLVELMLAMLYVALLLVTIATLIMHVMDSYKKGMAIKEVNINARAIIDDITQTVANAPPIGSLENSWESGNHSKNPHDVYAPPSGTTYYQGIRTLIGNLPDGGILCTGNYSYIWKHADRLPSDWRIGQGENTTADGTTADGTGNRGDLRIDKNGDNDDNDGNDGRNFRLVKVRDTSRTACKDRSTNDSRFFNLSMFESGAAREGFVELLTNNEMDLALYDFKVFEPATSKSNGQTFYGFSFVLGTIRGVNRSGEIIPNESCIPPQSYRDGEGNQDDQATDPDEWENSEHMGFDFSYCSVNKFNFSARSSGAVLKGSS
jgi:type II secretory pathway pseudopilin PulG